LRAISHEPVVLSRKCKDVSLLYFFKTWR